MRKWYVLRRPQYLEKVVHWFASYKFMHYLSLYMRHSSQVHWLIVTKKSFWRFNEHDTIPGKEVVAAEMVVVAVEDAAVAVLRPAETSSALLHVSFTSCLTTLQSTTCFTTAVQLISILADHHIKRHAHSRLVYVRAKVRFSGENWASFHAF